MASTRCAISSPRRLNSRRNCAISAAVWSSFARSKARRVNVDTIQVNIGNDVDVEYQNTLKGTTDYASGGIPPTEWKNVVQKYGLNKKDGRVQVRPLLDVRYVAMNHNRPLFKDNPGLAKAVNWTVDRQAFSAQGGYLYGKRTGQILPPGMLGYKPQGIYPLRVTANTTRQAKKLATEGAAGQKPGKK